MSAIILTNAFISIDGTEYSGQNTSVALSMSKDAEDVTTMGNTTRINATGLMDWGISCEFIADESVTGQSFFDLFEAGVAVPVTIRATAAAIGATNPSYEGDAVCTEYNVLEGEVGAAHKVSLSFVSAGPLSRVTVAA